MERLCGHAQSGGGTALDLARAHPEHFAAADIIVRTQPHPGGEGRGTPELGEIRANLSKQGLRDAGPDAGNSGQVNSEGALQLRFQDSVGGELRGRRWCCRRLSWAWCLDPLQLLPDLAITVIDQLVVTAISG